MSPDNVDRVDHWRALAFDTLIAAAETTEPQSRALLVSISLIYENLARQAEASILSAPTLQPVVLIKNFDD
jgi:hypothetical protein